jgi:hypothetical protein
VRITIDNRIPLNNLARIKCPPQNIVHTPGFYRPMGDQPSHHQIPAFLLPDCPPG